MNKSVTAIGTAAALAAVNVLVMLVTGTGFFETTIIIGLISVVVLRGIVAPSNRAKVRAMKRSEQNQAMQTVQFEAAPPSRIHLRTIYYTCIAYTVLGSVLTALAYRQYF